MEIPLVCRNAGGVVVAVRRFERTMIPQSAAAPKNAASRSRPGARGGERAEIRRS